MDPVRLDHGNDGFDRRFGLDAHEHGAITQPLGDPYAVDGGEPTQIAPDRLEQVHGGRITVVSVYSVNPQTSTKAKVR